MIRPLVAALAVVSLSACNSEEPAPKAEETVLPDLPEPTEAVALIPTGMHGRWGLVPGDCTSTRGDNKGLITVDGSTIKFYESRATLQEVKEASDTRLVGSFAFTGEGQEWTVDEVLELTADGTLTRSEQGEDAMAGTLTYSLCEEAA